jgi:hypothetical protein
MVRGQHKKKKKKKNRKQRLPTLIRDGGYPEFVSAYLSVWLQQAGYKMYYIGKLFNLHTMGN